MEEVDTGGLVKAKRVISSVMRTKGAKLLFNKAVDPEALGLPDYLDVISSPIDLGTIISRLEDSLGSAQNVAQREGPGMGNSMSSSVVSLGNVGGQQGGEMRRNVGQGEGEKGGYNSVDEVLEDVCRVWENCYTYNWRECDAPTRGVCDEVKRSFEKAWRAAGLKLGKEGGRKREGTVVRGGKKVVAVMEGVGDGTAWMEEDVPDRFSARTDGGDLPLRLLDDFSVSVGDRFTSLDKLGTVGSDGMTARGFLVPQPSMEDGSADGAEGGRLCIQLGNLLDWSIQYGESPGLWIITKDAWYRLLHPSKEYEEYLSSALGKFDFCIKASELQENGGGQQTFHAEIVDRLMDSVFASTLGSPVAVDANENMAFVRSQLVSWLKVGKQSPDGDKLGESRKPAKLIPNNFKGSPEVSNSRMGSRSSSRKRPRPTTKDESEKSGMTPMPSVKSSPTEANAPGNDPDDVMIGGDELEGCPLPPKSPSRTTSKKLKAGSVKMRSIPEKDARAMEALERDIKSQEATTLQKEEPSPGGFGNTTKARSQRIRVKLPSHVRAATGLASTNISPVTSPPTSIPADPPSLTGTQEQLSESDASGTTQPSDRQPGPSTQNSPHTTRRKASFLTLMDLSDTSDSDDALISKKKKKLSDFERKRLRRAKEERAKIRKDLRQDEVRGDPPDPDYDFRICQTLIGEVLSIWEFVMAFSGILQVAPFPLWRLEAAISPLNKPGKGGTNMESGAPVVDRAGLASGALLRDIHNGLLRLVEGKATNGEAPSVAKLMEEERVNPSPWFQRVSLFLLRAPLDEVDDETRNLGQFLQTHDYVELNPRSRLRILRALMDLSLGTELLRENINGYMEGGGAQKKKADGMEEVKSNDPMNLSESGDVERSSAAADNGGPWMEWIQSCKLGYMKVLGEDIRGRKYWVMGGRAGAWKVFVETPPEYTQNDEPTNENPHRGPQSEWGWYEGIRLEKLIVWLREGGLQYEKPLLTLLEKIPSVPRSSFTNQQYQDGQKGSELRKLSGELQGGSQVDYGSLRVDGYISIVAPHLRGEGDCPEMAYSSPMDLRVVVCIQNLLGLAPFWLDEGGRFGDKICMVIEGLRSAGTIYDLIRQLLNAEEVLEEYKCLRSEWCISWRYKWRMSALACQTIEDAALHLVTLQEFLKADPHRLHRTAFNACAAEARCPLYFPLPVEGVVFLRTGCLLHVKKYLSLADGTSAPGNTTGDSEEPEEEKEKDLHVDQVESVPMDEDSLPEDLLIAKNRVSKLGPVERFKIACVSYRSPFACDYPSGTYGSEMTPASAPQLQCLWLLMQSQISTPGAPMRSIAVPIHIDNTLADFVVKTVTYDQGTRKHWKTGERFRMFFGGKSSRGGQGGVYYKGTVVLVEDVKPGEQYDPWESIMVEWDNDSSESPLMKVSPWEIEIDPEEEQRLEEERRREEEARSRAARAAAKQQRTEYIASLGAYEGASTSPNDPDFDPEMDIPGLARNRRRGTSLNEMVYYDPSSPVGPIPAAVIQALPDREGFTILIYNFMRRLKGKFKCPIFAGHELDLHRVFHEVQNRGGYDRVTQLKLWKEVCRTLNVNLTGQTSASYNMRLNYEKCLLDFEHYLAKGEYTREVAEGTGPSATRLDSGPVASKPRSPVRPSSSPMIHLQSNQPDARPPQQSILGQSVNIGMSHQHHSTAPYGQMPSTGFSMTELLLADEFGQDFAAHGPGGSWGSTVPVSASMMSPSWLRMLAPSSNSNSNQASRATTAEPPSSQGWVEHPEVGDMEQPTPPVEPCDNGQAYAASLGSTKIPMVEIQPGESIGMALNRMGRALVGADIWRRWPECGADGWFKALVTDFRHSSNEHCLTYNQGSDNERHEWVDLRELESEELSQFAPETRPSILSLEPHGASGVNKSAMHAHNQSQVGLQLGAPPPIHKFGHPKLISAAQSHRGLVQRSDGHARELISQVIQMGVNPEHVKILDSNQSSILSQAEKPSSMYASETPAQRADNLVDGMGHSAGETLASQQIDLGNFSSFPSLSNFSGPIELSGGRGVLPGFEAHSGNAPSLFEQPRGKPLDSELQLPLVADGETRFPTALGPFSDKKPLQVILGDSVKMRQAEAWTEAHKAEVPSLSMPQRSEFGWSDAYHHSGSFPADLHARKFQGQQAQVSVSGAGGIANASLGTEMGCEIPRKADSFKIKFSIPQKKQ